MAKTWFTSDLHLHHLSILKYTARDSDEGIRINPKLSLSLEERMRCHDEWVTSQLNTFVGERDYLYIIGDIYMGSNQWTAGYYISQINCVHKVLIGGNHDYKLMDFYRSSGLFEAVYDHRTEIKLNEKRIVLDHFPIAEWNNGHHGSWHLHGHCVDASTEILTVDGWKTYETISEGDVIPNIDPVTGFIVNDEVKSVVKRTHTGLVYSLNSKSVNFRVTDQHRLVGYNRNGEFTAFTAENCSKRRRFNMIRASMASYTGLSLSDDMLRLYTYCVADGSLKEETDLWRIRVKKEHKIREIPRVLRALNIQFAQHPQKDGSISFDFYTPNELKGFWFKGLDEELRDMTPHQFDVLLDAYSLSDGSGNGNGILITTAKEQEADLLAELAVTRGWGCTTLRRENHGFGKLSWQLSLYPAHTQLVNLDAVKTEKVKRELFWCVTTNNGNFFMRREGKIHVTGNCHSNFDYKAANLHDKRILDVGWDNAKIVLGEYRPFEFADILKYMEGRVSIEHHGKAD